MKPAFSLIFTALVVLSAAACASTPAPQQPLPLAAADASGQTCRQIISPLDEGDPIVCGTAEQWAEFDRRAAEINEGVTCRTEPGASTQRCMTDEQWATEDRLVRNYQDAARLGDASRNAAATYTPPMNMTTTMPSQ